MNSLAAAYLSEGKDAEAERVYRDILDAFKQAKDSELVLLTKSSLELLYRSQRRLAEAELLLADVGLILGRLRRPYRGIVRFAKPHGKCRMGVRAE